MEFIHVLNLLSDGEFHSGEEMGRTLGVTRTVIWHAMRAIQELGMEVYAINGRGYRIINPLNLLSVEKIVGFLPADINYDIELFSQLDSTNHYLLTQLGAHDLTGKVCIAEQQRAGRGRRGRRWHSPFASNLYCSLVWRFDTAISALSGISLAIALAIVKTLEDCHLSDIAVKWPNDVYCHGKKIAGVLLEVKGDMTGPCDIVIGIGLNVNQPLQVVKIDQPWTCMQSSAANKEFDRNQVLAILLTHVDKTLKFFQQSGFEVLRSLWQQYDMLHEQEVEITSAQGSFCGQVKGVNAQGHLLFQCGEKLLHLSGGEVSVKKKQMEWLEEKV